MAFKLISTNGQVQYNIDEFALDSVDELKKLPQRSAMGSTAIILSTGDVYVKNGKGEWVLLGGSDSGGSSGGGSGSGDGTISYNSLTDKPSLNGTTIQGNMEIKSIPNEQIDLLFPQN